MRWVAALALFALAACGVDGPPVPQGGVTVSGEAKIGITGQI